MPPLSRGGKYRLNLWPTLLPIPAYRVRSLFHAKFGTQLSCLAFPLPLPPSPLALLAGGRGGTLFLFRHSCGRGGEGEGGEEKGNFVAPESNKCR